MWMKNVEILEDIGFDVVVTLTDGNEVNHKFFKSLTADKAFRDSIQNPFNLHRLIYMAFDPVHLFKCFYTNLQSRQTFAHLHISTIRKSRRITRGEILLMGSVHPKNDIYFVL